MKKLIVLCMAVMALVGCGKTENELQCELIIQSIYEAYENMLPECIDEDWQLPECTDEITSGCRVIIAHKAEEQSCRVIIAHKAPVPN